MTERIPLPSLSESIIRTLLYYDIFLYPLTSSEVFQYLPTNHVTEEEVNHGLHQLADQSVIYRLGNFFSIQNNLELQTRRSRGNQLAVQSLELARRKSRLISRFPYVRGVLISGSLAKGYMDENSDLDFFIITQPGRLWIARTLLVLYKRVFLLNSHKHFCVNYFVDSAHLEIEEKNLFTATELATLIPMCGQHWYDMLLVENSWIKSFFPNYEQRSLQGVSQEKSSGIKKIVETAIDFLVARKLETFFKKITLRRWTKKYSKNYNPDDFSVAFKTKEYVSKNHPHNYQRRVIDLYDEKLRTFAAANKLAWQV